MVENIVAYIIALNITMTFIILLEFYIDKNIDLTKLLLYSVFSFILIVPFVIYGLVNLVRGNDL